jgi:outer membrane protein assembly factor BamD (BamD/ComL family)
VSRAALLTAVVLAACGSASPAPAEPTSAPASAPIAVALDPPDVLFREGRLYYDRAIYDSAARLFAELLERFPTSEYAPIAGELILDSFSRVADYANLETWARRLETVPAFASAEAQSRLDTLIVQALFAQGEQLAGRGEHAAAAEAFEHAADEFPNDPRAWQALYNAGSEWEASGDVAGAARVHDHLAERYPGSADGAPVAPPRTPTAAAPDPHSPECEAERAEITDSMAASRDAAACVSPADCAVVMGPRHPDPEYAEVVAASDAAALEAAASAHIDRCGASAYHVAIDAFRSVEAGCDAGRCVALETTFHVE